jgi:chlorobactene glucosyltransferase
MRLFWLVLPCLLTMWAILLHNLKAFPRISAPQYPAPSRALPPVSILIPARNEAASIQCTLQHLLAQEHRDFELLLLDDESTDGTAAIALATAGEDSRFRLIQGSPPPSDWTGKNWACYQLSIAARHSILIFTDADVRWQPGSLTAVLTHFQQSEADLLTIWPTQVTVSWIERLVVPLMALAIWSYLPVSLVHHSGYASAAAANGQCMIFRRRAYAQIGGHGSVARTVLDDVSLSRMVKRSGYTLRMADAAGFLTCRMYHDSTQLLAGFQKNILAGHGGRPVWLWFSTLFHLLIFVFPWMWLPVALRNRKRSAVTAPLLLAVLGTGLRAASAAATRQRVLDAIWLPFSVLAMTVIATNALWGHWRRNAPEWKGRRLPHPPVVNQ